MEQDLIAAERKGVTDRESAVATQEIFIDTAQDAGHIAGFSDWTPDKALALAGDDGINLGKQHWLVILFMREHYLKHRSCPMLKMIMKKVNQMTREEALNVRAMFGLFGSMPVRTAARFAGLPDPDACT